MNTRRVLVLSFILAALGTLAFLLWTAMPAAPVYATSPADTPQLPASKIVSGVLTNDDIWGPNQVITITSDVLINPGTTVVINPGTTIRIATTDGANLGSDPTRIEYLVQGTLQANGPVTFTSLSPTPTCADWVGIYFQSGSSGYLDQTLVEYGVHAVEIGTLNAINITNSTLRFNCHTPPSGSAWGAGMAIYAGTHQIIGTDIYGNLVRAGAGGAWAEGGGVQIVPGTGPSLFQDCKIYENLVENPEPNGDAAGGGMNILFSDPIVHHCEIFANQVIADRRAFGGGVCLDNSNAVIRADTFVHDNGAMAQNLSAYGGGISIGQAMTPGPVTPVIKDSRVMTNVVGSWQSYGGGIGFYDESWTTTVISDTKIVFNHNVGEMSAGGGIGMAPGASADRFEDDLIRENLAIGNSGGACGGGICLTGWNDVDVTNNLVANNLVDDPPGAWSRGGGIFASGPDSHLINNTVVSNTAINGGEGGGIYLNDGLLLNTIVANNTANNDGGGVFWLGGTADFNDVWNNLPNDYDSSSVPPPNDISANPHFFGTGTPATFYHLQANSPCIDAGTVPPLGIPTDDYDDEARPRAVTWDIGFDEVYEPIFAISKQASGSLIAGLPLTYTLSVVNSGPGAGTGIVIDDVVPAGANYLWGGSYAGGVVNWTVPNIPANGGSAQVTFGVSTCQTSLMNQSYRVVTSTEGAASGWGPLLTTNLSPPTIDAGFSHWPATVEVSESVNFIDASTTNGSPLVTWSWDFGDGSGAIGTSVVHSYSVTGSYTVTLVVSDACGFAGQIVKGQAVLVTEAGSLPARYYLPFIIKNY